MATFRTLSRHAAGTFVGAFFAVVSIPPAAAQGCEFRLVDASPTGQPGNGNSLSLALSGDGRYVAFETTSTNLGPVDQNGKRDVYVHDLSAGTTELASLTSSGAQANDVSIVCDISADGRFVVFRSWANNLDPADQDGKGDIYVRDRLLGITEWISVPLTPENSVWDAGSVASVSDDGRFVAFQSADENIIPIDINGWADVFVRDRALQSTVLVSQSTSGEQADLGAGNPLISSDGNRVLFASAAKNLHPSGATMVFVKAHLYYHDLDTGLTEAIDLDSTGSLPRGAVSESFDMSPDGSTVVFWGDGWLTGHWQPGHVLWREGQPGYQTIGFPNGKPGWGLGEPRLSENGRYVAFSSSVADWTVGPLDGTNVHLHDTNLGVTSVATSMGPATWTTGSNRATISHDGKVMAFITADPVFTTLSVPNQQFAAVRLCDVTPGLTFCFPTRSPIGCLPSLIGSGTPTATSGVDHDLVVGGVRNGEIGLFLYGTGGDQALPIGNGWLCVVGALTRTAVQATGGALPPAQDCSGSLQFDFNAWIASGADPALVAGTPVYVQSWSRDPTHALGALLSDAAAFVLGP